MITRLARITSTGFHLIAVATFLTMPLMPVRLAAQAPKTLSFQGQLAETGGTPVNSTVSITFKLYKGATNVWTETQPSVQVVNGIFNVLLGTVTPLDTVTFNQPMDLGIKVGADPEISPRTPLAASALSLGMPGMHTTYYNVFPYEGYNVIGGSQFNSVAPDVLGATIAGGGSRNTGSMSIFPNTVTDNYGTIGGGSQNTSGQSATVAGGTLNMASGLWAAIGGGSGNQATMSYATVGGGESNHATGGSSTVAGGTNNVAGDGAAAVGGGGSNQALGSSSTIGGGANNRATATNTTVGGGSSNRATAIGATVPGGSNNAARGEYSLAAGYNARPHHNGSFVWGDRSVTGIGDSLVTTANNQFLIRATGGVGIGTNNPGNHSLAINDSDAGGIAGASLHVDNNSTGNGIAAHLETSGIDASLVIDQYGTGDHIRTFANGDLRFRVYNNGNVTADGSFTGGGADLAEAVDVDGRRDAFEAGDVLVVSTAEDRSFAKCAEPYSDLVAGVYATKPGVLMTNRGMKEDLSDRVPMGVVGIIPTKVTTENGPIRRGDLLVTSSTPGHAMKGDRSRLEFGMVLGKALEPFDGAIAGIIEVLVLPR